MPTPEDTQARVIRVIEQQLGTKVQISHKIVEDLGADSLDTIELVMAVEDEFGIEISDDEAEACRTAQDCADLVARKLGMVAAGASDSEGGEAA